MTDSTKRFVGLATEIIARIEETDGRDWWSDVEKLSEQLEVTRRGIAPVTEGQTSQWPAFFITSVGQSDQLIGIAAEFAPLLRLPIEQGRISAHGVMLVRDPIAESCDEIRLWHQESGSIRICYASDTSQLAIKTLHRWIRFYSMPAEGSKQNAGQSHSDVEHSPNFRSFRWFGTLYTFTPNQAQVVKMLYENWRAGTPDVGDEALLCAIDPVAPPSRLNVVFRNNAAWGTAIVHGRTRGSHRLADPGEDIA